MKPVTIVGGGLAGLTLGIGLRQRDIPVTLWEAGHYPRHRVCGEFISGRGLESLTRLGLRRLLENAGGVAANSAAFFSNQKGTSSRTLPESALCLSRFKLDELLAKEFRRQGGELREGSRWNEDAGVDGIVRATGRRVQAEENGFRWFGVKAHVRNVPLIADLEMHVSPQGYVGLCRLQHGEVNVCGLFQRRTGSQMTICSQKELLRGQPDSALRRRLEAAEFDEDSICTVAGLSMQPHRAEEWRECCVGDSVTMIPPLTGNGMSMAFESAELAIAPLVKWSRGELSWKETQKKVADECDAAFARRLKWARCLQRLVLNPAWQNVLVLLANRSEWFWRSWFTLTR